MSKPSNRVAEAVLNHTPLEGLKVSGLQGRAGPAWVGLLAWPGPPLPCRAELGMRTWYPLPRLPPVISAQHLPFLLSRCQHSWTPLGLKSRLHQPRPASLTPICSSRGTSRARGLGLVLKLQVRTWALSGQWGPAVHPSRREKVKSKRVPRCPVATGHADLEAELEGIQQQLQHYQSTKQNLRSCQRQANSLRKWLELSREEPRPEDQAEEQKVQKELEEVEVQIQLLAEELRAQRQPIGACIARIQALRQALC